MLCYVMLCHVIYLGSAARSSDESARSACNHYLQENRGHARPGHCHRRRSQARMDVGLRAISPIPVLSAHIYLDVGHRVQRHLIYKVIVDRTMVASTVRWRRV